MIRVFVLADGEIARHGLCARLSNIDDVDLVGNGRSGDDALYRLRQANSQVIVMYARLTDRELLRCSRVARAADPSLRVLLMTSADQGEAALIAIIAGASGLIPAAAPAERLADQLRQVAAGPTIVDATLLRTTLDQLSNAQRRCALSAGEQELLEYLARGLTDQQIAWCLGVEAQLASYRVAALTAKLDAAL